MIALALALALGGSAFGAPPRAADERVVLRTDAGDLLIALYPDAAPRHVAQFLKLARLGAYDGTHFYRVEPGYLIQASNAQDKLPPLTARQQAAIERIPAEFGKTPHAAGVLSMAHPDGNPDGAETSFSILLAPAPHLDGRYTVFGRVEKGYDVLDALAAASTDGEHRPLIRLSIRQAVVLDAGALPRFALRPARRLDEETRTAPAPWLGVLLCVMTLLSLAGAYLADGKAPACASLNLLAVLAGFFALLAAYAPAAPRRPWLATALFFGAVGIFRLMGFFERPR